MSFDYVLSHGTLVDGTGASRRLSDVGISNGCVTQLAEPGTLAGRHVIDCSGMTVAPGFIDVHTHDDRALIDEPDMRCKLTQGVTTVVSGNCGISLAPDLDGREAVPPLDILGSEKQFRYKDFAHYLHAVGEKQPAVNVYPLVGLTTIRVRTMENTTLVANDRETALMRAACEAALRAGALGVSIGTFYPPAAAASTSEVIACCESLRRVGGILSVHLRDESDGVIGAINEACEIARALDSPLVISHHKVVGTQNFGRSVQTLECLREAALRQAVSFDAYPYDVSSTMLKLDRVLMASRTTVTWSATLPHAAGMEISEICTMLGCSVENAVTRLTPAGASYQIMHEDDVERIIVHPLSMIGSDGLPHDVHPHPRLWGTFPRVLQLYVRERNTLSLESAVHKMTGHSATQLGLTRRGRLLAGFAADIVVFDSQKIAAEATFKNPARAASGVNFVFVNGQLALDRDGRQPGRFGHVITRAECVARGAAPIIALCADAAAAPRALSRA